MAAIKVALVGATGRTGQSIVDGLLDSADPKFELTALVRPSSIDKPAVDELRARGVSIVAIELLGPEDELVAALTGIDVVIASLAFSSTGEQIPLADAALKAGVKRFVPSAWATASPPRGVMTLSDWKEDVLDHIKKISLPYTSIDVGFWHDVLIPRVPSGKLDRAAVMCRTFVLDDRSVPFAAIARCDIGRYVARIIADPRTLNRRVFAYSDVWTRREAIELVERVSGESVPTTTKTAAQVTRAVGRDDVVPPHRFILEYMDSVWVRGDSEPEVVRSRGYLDGKELYPDLETKPLDESVREALAGAEGDVGAMGGDEFWEQLDDILETSK